MNFDKAALERLEHAFLEHAFAALPPGPASLLVLATAVCLTLFIHRAAFRVLSRVVENQDLFWRSLVSRSRRPLRLAILIVALSV